MAIMAVAVFVGACGGSKATEGDAAKDDGPSGSSTTTTVEGGATGGAAVGKSGTPTTQKASGGSTSKAGGSSTAKSAGGGGGEGSTPTTEKPKDPLPLEASLKSSCVKAGGQQSITVKVPPGSGVGYNSYYADGKSGLHEGFYGGNNGKAVDDGTWTDTWVIAPSAPAGKVRVAVLAGHIDYESAERDLFFDLVPATGTCP